MTPAGGSLAASYRYPATTLCGFGFASGWVTDADKGLVAFAEPTDAGYAVYTLPIAGGPATQIFADDSGTACGQFGGDSVSASHVVLNEFSFVTFLQRAIGVDENGPASQTPVMLAGDANSSVLAHYTIDGHVWIDVRTFGQPTSFSEVVVDGDGTTIATYPNSRLADDIWGGIFISGQNPVLDRQVVYLFNPAGGLPCNGGTLIAVDPISFATTNIDGVPADACRPLAYGWVPASIGSLSEPAGSSAIEIDPVGGHMYILLGPRSDGVFTNLALPGAYPFF